MSEASERPDGPGGLRKTCDQCRSRKVRCDRETPCSNCRITQRECSFTGALQKPRAARQRVLISHQYESKIDSFEARLTGIEGMLRELTTSLKRGGGTSTPHSESITQNYISPSCSTAGPNSICEGSSVPDVGDSDAAFEGDSSLTAHTTFASEFLEKAVTNTSRQLNPEMQTTLASLQKMVRMQNRKGDPLESRLDHQQPMPKGGYSQLPLPPTDVILKLLRRVKAAPPMTFLMSLTFVTVEDFVDACRKLYFPTEDYNIGIFITVNTGLYYLFQDNTCSATEDFSDEECLKYQMMSRDNLETALANLPLLLPARKDMVEALVLSATYAVEVSKLSLAWQLNSAAAMICQTLGWHRLQGEDGTSDARITLFWFCYMLDKGLALRFGRTSVIQDWDVSATRHFDNTTLPTSWNLMIGLWINTGGILGEIYQNLYSPSALARDPNQRVETARLLVEKMERIWNDMVELSYSSGARDQDSLKKFSKDPHNQTTLDMVHKSGRVSHLANLTLIYRAIPSAPGLPSTFNAECIDAARGAFSCHFECMELIADNSVAMAGYLHWTILYSPFTPFIVLFCHVIETSNIKDLQLLDQFAESLQPALSISQAIEKLFRLCKLLHQIAALYVEAKGQQKQDSDMNMVGNDLDIYLSQLGFISQNHASENMNISATPGPGTAPIVGSGQELGDWFSGNRYILGLMEDDFLDIDPGMWSGI
ncbi:hypothetical protein TWF106_006902 [Orbilia oligospora]|uniref:Zn(2)-C6 fungal-type domain-containing protein n=1 Tax=Orbilia oligospora TaxID=2813651 RepID=A0A6G1M2D3_ORBOL|nr:hypothetical protein TWF191_000380 [Orbilia oligospora]KAF3219748.1 hypothetical protein TWF106_006902 [Orbilia oligospora]KAF3242605.1 hypothetical protein TWF192_008609 [Orbilia oligospora]